MGNEDGDEWAAPRGRAEYDYYAPNTPNEAVIDGICLGSDA
jgi:hypothetical protein